MKRGGLEVALLLMPKPSTLNPKPSTGLEVALLLMHNPYLENTRTLMSRDFRC